ncbi:response regulator [Xanthomarina gelatinilytica]|uniref:response regulator n=1 Tax=Xanthomarina gelatinilytica TaxID=1137281 RepID=UPI003AA9A3D6
MLTNTELKKLEIELFEKGLSNLTLRKIRNSKICIIDNEVKDLKSFFDGLKTEGFTNLNKFKKSPSINDILNEHYDIILLDLNDVAQDMTEMDGLGVLQLLKQRNPNLPILVITGQNPSPEVRDILNLADGVRKKPVLASDLANDVDIILRYYHDKYWASILLLKELNKIDIELKRDLGFIKRVKLHYLRKSLETKLIKKEDDVITKIEKIIKILRSAKSMTSIIAKLSSNLALDA